MLDDLIAELMELIRDSDEVRLAVDLDECGNLRIVCHIGCDDALGGDAAGLLLGLGNALLSQVVDGLVHIAIRFRKRLFAVHHACARALAQLLDHLCVNLCHLQPPRLHRPDPGGLRQ